MNYPYGEEQRGAYGETPNYRGSNPGGYGEPYRGGYSEGYSGHQPSGPLSPGPQTPSGSPEPLEADSAPRVDNGPFFAGLGATALVAAIAGWVLTAIFQALYARFEWGTLWLYGMADPWTAAFTGAVAALASGTLMWVMVQGVPSPTTFYSWIASLIAIASVVLPFLAVNPWQSALGTGLIHGFLGVVIIVLTEVVAAKTVHL